MKSRQQKINKSIVDENYFQNIAESFELLAIGNSKALEVTDRVRERLKNNVKQCKNYKNDFEWISQNYKLVKK
ncbi:hypothetical protein ISS03_05575 [Patescibacteria group bacterium]|nr:hypothetical protein [Patescibacteria group bacterium]